jgi:predicted nucleic acid-binding protein
MLTRALEPFPFAVRTLDALHLASMDFLRANGQVIQLATYDRRLASAASAMGIALADT